MLSKNIFLLSYNLKKLNCPIQAVGSILNDANFILQISVIFVSVAVLTIAIFSSSPLLHIYKIFPVFSTTNVQNLWEIQWKCKTNFNRKLLFRHFTLPISGTSIHSFNHLNSILLIKKISITNAVWCSFLIFHFLILIQRCWSVLPFLLIRVILLFPLP